MVHRALGAAEKLAAEGIEAEVIDIRALRPMDLTNVFESVRRTNNLVTVEEQAQVGGWGAEVVAQVTERGLRLPGFPAAAGDPAGLPRALQPAAGGQRIALAGFHRGGGQVAAVERSSIRWYWPLPFSSFPRKREIAGPRARVVALRFPLSRE